MLWFSVVACVHNVDLQSDRVFGYTMPHKTARATTAPPHWKALLPVGGLAFAQVNASIQRAKPTCAVSDGDFRLMLPETAGCAVASTLNMCA